MPPLCFSVSVSLECTVDDQVTPRGMYKQAERNRSLMSHGRHPVHWSVGQGEGKWRHETIVLSQTEVFL